jgi:hypothetical protein
MTLRSFSFTWLAVDSSVGLPDLSDFPVDLSFKIEVGYLILSDRSRYFYTREKFKCLFNIDRTYA